MANHNKAAEGNDKTTEISFYVMFGSLILGFVLVIAYIIYGFLG